MMHRPGFRRADAVFQQNSTTRFFGIHKHDHASKHYLAAGRQSLRFDTRGFVFSLGYTGRSVPPGPRCRPHVPGLRPSPRWDEGGFRVWIKLRTAVRLRGRVESRACRRLVDSARVFPAELAAFAQVGIRSDGLTVGSLRNTSDSFQLLHGVPPTSNDACSPLVSLLHRRASESKGARVGGGAASARAGAGTNNRSAVLPGNRQRGQRALLSRTRFSRIRAT